MKNETHSSIHVSLKKNPFFMLLTIILALKKGRLSFAHCVATYTLCRFFDNSYGLVLTVKDIVLLLSVISLPVYKTFDITF